MDADPQKTTWYKCEAIVEGRIILYVMAESLDEAQDLFKSGLHSRENEREEEFQPEPWTTEPVDL